ncbi:hypothetical protein AB4114_04975 [Paenibacillus sp. 2RAB27]|nr:hypothetical protein [Paenibacillus plantarum]
MKLSIKNGGWYGGFKPNYIWLTTINPIDPNQVFFTHEGATE